MSMSEIKNYIVTNDNGEHKLIFMDKVREKMILATIGKDVMTILNKHEGFTLDTMLSSFYLNQVVPHMIKLKYPEKSLQVLLAKLPLFSPEKGWKQEHSYTKDNRRDITFFTPTGDVPMFVEIKNFNLNNGVSEKEKREAELQALNYAQECYTRNKKKCAILISIIFGDGQHILDNPNKVNNLMHDLQHNAPHLKTFSYIYDGINMMENQDAGIMDWMEINSLTQAQDMPDMITTASEQLVTLNNLSNPRNLNEEKAQGIAYKIIDNITDALNVDDPKGLSTDELFTLFYFASYSNQKQIQVSGSPHFYEHEGYHIMYGRNLSLSNGQHSTFACYLIFCLLMNKNVELTSRFPKLEKKIAPLKQIMIRVLGRDNISVFCEKCLKISAKITSAPNKKIARNIANASNTTVGRVDTNANLINSFIKTLNEKVYDEQDKRDQVLQIDCAHCTPSSNCVTLPYSALYVLNEFDQSKKTPVLSTFRTKNLTNSQFEKFYSDLSWCRQKKLTAKNLKDTINDKETKIQQLQKEMEQKAGWTIVNAPLPQDIYELRMQIKTLHEEQQEAENQRKLLLNEDLNEDDIGDDIYQYHLNNLCDLSVVYNATKKISGIKDIGSLLPMMVCGFLKRHLHKEAISNYEKAREMVFDNDSPELNRAIHLCQIILAIDSNRNLMFNTEACNKPLEELILKNIHNGPNLLQISEDEKSEYIEKITDAANLIITDSLTKKIKPRNKKGE